MTAPVDGITGPTNVEIEFMSGDVLTPDLHEVTRLIDGVPLTELEVSDPPSELNKADQLLTNYQLGLISAIARDNPERAKQIFFGQSEVFELWNEGKYTARALEPLQRPGARRLADGIPLDDVTERWFHHGADAIGIRNRHTVMRALMVDHFENWPPDQPIEWASIACGAAIPVLLAARDLMNQGKEVKVTLVDQDELAIERAQEIAQEIGFEGYVDVELVNILSRDGNEWFSSNADRFQAVDGLGIAEYIRDDDNAIGKFLSRLHKITAEGGMTVTGQMLDTRPYPEFLHKVIEWEYVLMRSRERIVEMHNNGGIQSDRLHMYTTNDGMYAVTAMHKPMTDHVPTNGSTPQ